MYDVVIKNGRVIDPSMGIDEVKTIAIKDGVFVQYDGKEDIRKLIDAEGCFVTPGFVDAHSHVFYGGSGNLSTQADISCLPNCVTTVCDAGSSSTWSFEAFYKNDIIPSITNVIAALHPCITGVQLPPKEEDQNPEFFNTDEIIRYFKMYPETIKALKVRMSKAMCQPYGLKPVFKTQEIAKKVREAGYHCNVICHYGNLPDGEKMEDFIDAFQAGDIISHMYHPSGDSIFNQDGSVMECVKEARKRGVLFDSCRARVNSSIANLKKGAAADFFPDIISTDLGRHTLYWKPSYSMFWNMSIFLNIGMPIESIIKAVTYTPAKAFGILNYAGTLQEGRPGDVAIFKIIDSRKTFADLKGDKFVGEKIIMPMACVKGGDMFFQQIFMDDELS